MVERVWQKEIHVRDFIQQNQVSPECAPRSGRRV
jgi:hypothetical protein